MFQQINNFSTNKFLKVIISVRINIHLLIKVKIQINQSALYFSSLLILSLQAI